jgi:hypothetical protein
MSNWDFYKPLLLQKHVLYFNKFFNSVRVTKGNLERLIIDYLFNR